MQRETSDEKFEEGRSKGEEVEEVEGEELA